MPYCGRFRLTAVSQKRGGFFDEKTSFSGPLVHIVHILSFQNLEGLVWASLGIIVKNYVISRIVEIFLKFMQNQCFAFPYLKNGRIYTYEVSICV